MCQACLALASRRSGGAEDDGAGWLERKPSRFTGAVEWADETPAEDAPLDAGAEGESR